MTITAKDFTRVAHDVNGNPRFVVHFLQLNTPSERANASLGVGEKYAIALHRARKLGGRKFHNKQCGGGIVFSSYALDNEARDLQSAVDRDEAEQRASANGKALLALRGVLHHSRGVKDADWLPSSLLRQIDEAVAALERAS